MLHDWYKSETREQWCFITSAQQLVELFKQSDNHYALVGECLGPDQYLGPFDSKQEAMDALDKFLADQTKKSFPLQP